MRDSSNLRGDLPAEGQRGSPHLVLSYSNVMFEQVDKVELLQANPQYAHIRHPDGRETTVSIRHLAPCGDTETFDDSSQQSPDDNTTPTTSEDTTALETPDQENPRGPIDPTIEQRHRSSPDYY